MDMASTSSKLTRVRVALLFAGLGAAALVFACGSDDGTPPPPVAVDAASTSIVVRAAWVEYGDHNQAIARAITTNTSQCPQIVVDGTTSRMALRVGSASVAQRTTASVASLSKGSDFPVAVCEFVLPATAAQASVSNRTLPVPKANPQRIVVVGDTGCRLKQSSNAFQSCNDATQWPLTTVAAAAAAMKPDLVLHVGDYHYRENPCPADITGCAGSPWGYGWDTWDADLFTPAAALMAAAPWVVVRGNHEMCNRAGQGWFRFLDPLPYNADRSCDDPVNDQYANYTYPYAVGVGSGVQIIVFDSSSTGATALPTTDPQFIQYQTQLARVTELAATPGVNSIFANHHPALGYTVVAGSNPVGAYQYTAFQSVLGSVYPGKYYPAGVTLALAGHVHDFQAISFGNGSPATIVSGNGGDNLDVNLPDPFPPSDAPAAGVSLQAITHTSAFGFLVMDRVANTTNWTISAYTVAGKLLTKCTQAGVQLTCDKTGYVAPT
jgi:hypothetical protein